MISFSESEFDCFDKISSIMSILNCLILLLDSNNWSNVSRSLIFWKSVFFLVNKLSNWEENIVSILVPFSDFNLLFKLINSFKLNPSNIFKVLDFLYVSKKYTSSSKIYFNFVFTSEIIIFSWIVILISVDIVLLFRSRLIIFFIWIKLSMLLASEFKEI